MTVAQVRIKVCFILSHLPQGGAERQTINLIRGLDPSEFDISLILYSNEKIFYNEVHELPIRLIINPSRSTGKIRRTIKNILFLSKALRFNEFDILHTLLPHNGFWVRMVAPGRYARRIVYSIRNDIKDSPGFYRFFEKFLYRRSYVVTNSIKVLQQYYKYFMFRKSHNIRNIYNGFEVGKFLSSSPPPVSEILILGTVGRQAILKNQIQILKALYSILKGNPLHFYLIGDKHQNMAEENESYVKERNLESNVTILDSVSAIEEYYRRFNIFILSSLNESCPNVLFEAMLSKCLCIVSEGSNSDHFIEDGKNGLVYDGSLLMLEEKIVQAISMVKTGAHLSLVDNGERYAKASFSLDRMISEYKRLYYELIRDNSL